METRFPWLNTAIIDIFPNVSDGTYAPTDILSIYPGVNQDNKQVAEAMVFFANSVPLDIKSEQVKLQYFLDHTTPPANYKIEITEGGEDKALGLKFTSKLEADINRIENQAMLMLHHFVHTLEDENILSSSDATKIYDIFFDAAYESMLNSDSYEGKEFILQYADIAPVLEKSSVAANLAAEEEQEEVNKEIKFEEEEVTDAEQNADKQEENSPSVTTFQEVIAKPKRTRIDSEKDREKDADSDEDDTKRRKQGPPG